MIASGKLCARGYIGFRGLGVIRVLGLGCRRCSVSGSGGGLREKTQCLLPLQITWVLKKGGSLDIQCSLKPGICSLAGLQM